MQVDDDEMDDQADMKRLLDGIYQALADGDARAWAAAVADDVLLIGTDDAEWWQGKDTAMKFVEAQVQEMHDAGLRFSGGDPEVSVAGDVVWVADRPTVVLTDGTSLPMRLTAVATRENGELALRQMHVSIGVANEEVLDQELTV